jgi:membrane protein DedA with SNARE-associated domain
VDENFQALADWLSLYGYPVLFAAVFAENVGLPVPGETTVLVASLLASRPGSPLSILWIIVVTVLAAVLGDNLGFWLGRRWARGRLQQGKRFLFLTPRGLRAVEGYFEHYGIMTVFFARFIPGLRVVAAMAAGTSRMAWPRFLLANVGGAVVWGVSMSLLGFFFGHSWQALHRWLGRGMLVILGCAVLLVGLPYLWRRLQRLPAGSWNRLLRSQAWQGVLGAVLVVVCVAVLVLLAEHHAAPPREDRQVRDWIAVQHVPWLNAVATGGASLGSLPVVASLVALLGTLLWYAGRPWREGVALLGALAASEALGFILLVLLRHEGVEPAWALVWPPGVAGPAPLRGAAVYGMMAHVLGRPLPTWGRAANALAVALVLLIGFSVVWSREQLLTEVLVESVAGYLVLFVGRWWLAGDGLPSRPILPAGVVPDAQPPAMISDAERSFPIE